MAISAKPKQKSSNQNEASIAELINKGGSVASAAYHSDKEEQNVMLRVPRELLEKIDAELGKGFIKKKRHPWLLEAIVEKLQRAGSIES